MLSSQAEFRSGFLLTCLHEGEAIPIEKKDIPASLLKLKRVFENDWFCGPTTQQSASNVSWHACEYRHGILEARKLIPSAFTCSSFLCQTWKYNNYVILS